MKTRGPLCGALTGLAVLTTVAPAAFAQSEDIEQAPRVFSIQPRPYRLGHEFQLGIGVLPLDAFYIGAVGFASYTYHFTDFWGWEIAGAGYSHNFETGLKSSLKSNYGVEPVSNGGLQVNVLATTSAIIKPLFGKLSFFNRSFIYSETFFTIGIGLAQKSNNGSSFDYLAGVLGIGLRFWSGPALSFRFDIRDYLVFAQPLPDQVLLLLLSASFNYYDRPDKPRS